MKKHCFFRRITSLLCALMFMISMSLQAFAIENESEDVESTVLSSAAEYTIEDISRIIDKMTIATMHSESEYQYTVWNWFEKEILGLYRSGRPVFAEIKTHWHTMIDMFCHQYSYITPDHFFLHSALAASGTDMAEIFNWSFDTFSSLYTYASYLTFARQEQIDSEKIEISLKEVRKGVEGWAKIHETQTGYSNPPGMDFDLLMLILAPWYNTGDSKIDMAFERGLRHFAGLISPYSNNMLIMTLCAAGIDPTQTKLELKELGETIDISVEDKNLIDHLLSQLCDGEGQSVNIDGALNCESLAVTYTTYKYNTPTIHFDTDEALLSLAAYERFLQGRESIFCFEDVSVSRKKSDNYPPEVNFLRIAYPEEPLVLGMDGELTVNIPYLFFDVENDPLTYWVSINDEEAQQIVLGAAPDYMKDSSSYSEGDKEYYFWRPSPEMAHDGHQTVNFTFFAKDEHRRSTLDYSMTVELYREPSLHWLKYVIGDNAVTITGCSTQATHLVVPDTIDGKPVTNIAPYAFQNHRELISVKLPDTIKTIGKNAFSDCRQLEECNLPKELSMLGDNAFSNCRILKNVTLPKALKEFSINCFSGCTNLVFDVEAGHTEYASLEGSLYNKDYSALLRVGHRHDGLFIIPDMVVEIAAGAFELAELDKVEFGSSVKIIGERAFKFCAAGEYVFNDGLEEIGNYAFQQSEVQGYDQMRRDLENGTSLNYNIVVTPSEVKELIFPASLKKIGKAAFVGTRSLEKIDLSRTALTEIPERAFMGTAANDILLPENVEFIDDYAFALSNIEEMHLPKGTLYLGDGAFANCKSLKTLNLGSSLRYIGNSALYVPGLQLVIPATVRTVDTNNNALAPQAYYEGNLPKGKHIERMIVNSYCLENAYRWETVTNIEGGAQTYQPDYGEKRLILHMNPTFEIMKPLQTAEAIHVTAAGGASEEVVEWQSSDLRVAAVDNNGVVVAVGEGNATITAKSADAEGKIDVVVVGDTIFKWELKWDNTVEIQGLNADNRNFKGYMEIPETIGGYPVTTIASGSFEDNESITGVLLPDTLKTIGGVAFAGCTNLRELNIPDGVETIGGFAFTGVQIEELTLPPSLTGLGHNAFAHSSIKSLTINSPLLGSDGNFEMSGASAFWNCQELEEVNLSAIHTIGQGMFSECISLESVKFPESLQNISAHAFNYCISLEEVEFPKYMVNSSYYTSESENCPFYGANENLRLLHPDDGNMWDGLYGIANTEAVAGTGNQTLKETPQVFEIVQDMWENNPMLLSVSVLGILAVITMGAIRRYGKYKRS